MMLEIIKDGKGIDTGIFIPINDWNFLTQIHKDLKQLVAIEPSVSKNKLSDLAGKLSHETADAMQKHVLESRNDWKERLKKQF